MISMPEAQKITEHWLRECGFKWRQQDRQPSKHWQLMLGFAIGDGGELTIELASEVPTDRQKWFCWLVDDGRHLHIRHLTYQQDVIALVEAISGQEWNLNNIMYGNLYPPHMAERLRKEQERLL